MPDIINTIIGDAIIAMGVLAVISIVRDFRQNWPF